MYPFVLKQRKTVFVVIAYPLYLNRLFISIWKTVNKVTKLLCLRLKNTPANEEYITDLRWYSEKQVLSKKIYSEQKQVLVAVFNNAGQRNTVWKLKSAVKNATKTKNLTSKTYILSGNWYKLYYVAGRNQRSKSTY